MLSPDQILKNKILQIEETNPHRHRFSGMAVFDMVWLTQCLGLFKNASVNIKTLLIRPDFRMPQGSRRYFHIEFVIPPDITTESFLEALTAHLKQITWE